MADRVAERPRLAGAAKAIGERVRRYREARDWSQNELGRISGVNVAQINRLEQGKVRSSPHLHTMEALAMALGVTLEDLTGDVGTGSISEHSERAFFAQLLDGMDSEHRAACVEHAVWQRQRQIADETRNRSFALADDRRALVTA